MTSEYGYKEFDAPSVRSLKARLIESVIEYPIESPIESLGTATSNSINQGMAAMPAQERSIQIDGRACGGDQPQRQHREAMARNSSPQSPGPQGSNAEAQISQWDEA